ncbi:hypothetical protein F4808DRAFT_430560 [Astrocystis sublimbata]|nr:hypothetical protein F4808DRAFT_430560 [Astrocystis sublimbata]
MSGLTLNIDAAVSRSSPSQSQSQSQSQMQSQQQQHSSAHRPSASAAGSNNPPLIRTFQSTTPIPVPIPYASQQSHYHHQQQQQHHQQQLTRPHPQQPQQPSAHSSSPARPTYSPITPPLNATTFPPRAALTHNSHVDATAAPAPAPEPIDFDSNPDVLALKSAISILQMQRRKAERDMASLDRVKSAALAEPSAFLRDLTAGQVRVEGEGLLVGSVRGHGHGDDDGDSGHSSSESESESDDDDEETKVNIIKDGVSVQPSQTQTQTQQASAETVNIKGEPNSQATGPPPWAQIPKPQNVVRCPPINWSQYAVVGESLDKLHNDQLRRPAQGAPATLAPDGQFEFNGGDGRQEPYLGVAVPYAPGRDKIDTTSKQPPRR